MECVNDMVCPKYGNVQYNMEYGMKSLQDLECVKYEAGKKWNLKRIYLLNQKVFCLSFWVFIKKDCHKNVETCNKRNIILLTTQPRFTKVITHYKSTSESIRSLLRNDVKASYIKASSIKDVEIF